MSGTVNVDSIKNSAGTGGPDFPFGISGFKFPSNVIHNLGFSTSVATNALTINLTQSDGATNPSTGTGAVIIGMRSSSLTSGGYNQRSVTAATSIVVSSGATLGLPSSSINCVMWVYAIDNAGTIELAVSARLFREDSLATTTAMSGSATSFTTMYSTTARTNVSFRLIGKFFVPQTTAGTWTATPTQIQLNPFAIVQPITYQTFTSGTSQTYTISAGVTWFRVFMAGGGGGAGGSGTTGTGAGTGGTATTFGSNTANFGRGGGANFATTPLSNTISGAIGLDLQSNGGSPAGPNTQNTSSQNTGGDGGGNTLFCGTVTPGAFNATSTSAAANSGSGGCGAGMTGTSGSSLGAGGGGGGALELIFSEGNMKSQFTYTVGPGGSNGTAGTSGNAGGSGGSGLIVIEEHYDQEFMCQDC